MNPRGTVGALLFELSGMVDRLVCHGETSSIDLQALSLSPDQLKTLKEVLGTGPVTASVSELGLSSVWETRFAGIWWVRHRNADGAVVGEMLEVCPVPEVIKAPDEDTAIGAEALRLMLAKFAEQPA